MAHIEPVRFTLHDMTHFIKTHQHANSFGDNAIHHAGLASSAKFIAYMVASQEFGQQAVRTELEVTDAHCQGALEGGGGLRGAEISGVTASAGFDVAEPTAAPDGRSFGPRSVPDSDAERGVAVSAVDPGTMASPASPRPAVVEQLPSVRSSVHRENDLEGLAARLDLLRNRVVQPSPSDRAYFSTLADGNILDVETRRRLSLSLGISSEWAFGKEVHSADVREVEAAGCVEGIDAVFTRASGLPIMAYSADCVVVCIRGDDGVGVCHAGWKGMANGIVAKLLAAMRAAQCHPKLALVSPSIGPCCFEVQSDVSCLFPGYLSHTIQGTRSVDLWAAAEAQLAGLPIWNPKQCTVCGNAFFSHRRQKTARMGACCGLVAWL